jgi:hypothetical protein
MKDSEAIEDGVIVHSVSLWVSRRGAGIQDE